MDDPIDPILVSVRDRIATVTFNRPSQRNAINYFMWLDLQRILADLETDPGVRVVVFSGAGTEAFSAGADIKDFQTRRNNSAKARVWRQSSGGALAAVERFPKPTISMVRGYCVGGGCELAIASDIRVAARGSRFGITPAKLGIVVEYEEVRRLAAVVGASNAAYILLSGRLFNDEAALRMGIVSELVEPDELEPFTYKLAAELAANAPLSHQKHKQMLRIILENPGLRGLSREEQEMGLSIFDSEDFQEGVRAFLEKRRPDFQGR